MKLYALDEVSSTNDLALAAAGHAEHGDAWVAEMQTAGRGRREMGGSRRVWHSPASRNIYMSMVLKPRLEPARAAGLTLSAGIAVCEVLRTTGVDVWLKWPNDIFVGDKKLGGLLTEAVTSGHHLDAVVVGVGLNVNTTQAEVPEDLQSIMTSLHIESGRVHDRLALIHPLRDAVLAWTARYTSEGWEGLRTAMARLDRSVGRLVELGDGSHRRGVSEGIDATGQLRVRLDSGETLALSAGEVRILAQQP